MKKFVILTFTIFVFFCFSIVVFAEETQANDVEKSRYASSEEVFIVFEPYLNWFNPDGEAKLKEVDTVKKSYLYSLIKSGHYEKDLPTKIRLDLLNNPEDLITEQELLKYIDEIKENKVNETNVTVSFTPFFWIVAILFGVFSPRIEVKKKD